MVAHRLHPLVKEIINLFKQKQFVPLTVSQIARELNQSETSIHQAVQHDTFGCFEVTGKNPQKLQLKWGVDAVIFHLHNNQCCGCGNFFAPDKLRVVILDPQAAGKPSWMDIAPACLDCATKTFRLRKR